MNTIIAITVLSFLLWFSYEVWRAPLLDNDYNVIRPTKRLRDLFKYKKQDNEPTKTCAS